METISYYNFQARVHIAFFMSVQNGKEIRERIIKASTTYGEIGDAEKAAVNFAFVDAKLVFFFCLVIGPFTMLRFTKIASRRHLLTATYQSMLAESQQALKTKTVHSEIIWSLNSTNNVSCIPNHRLKKICLFDRRSLKPFVGLE